MNERVDQVLESCIEVESNRRLLDENLNYLTLTFKKSEMEKKVSLFEFNLDILDTYEYLITYIPDNQIIMHSLFYK